MRFRLSALGTGAKLKNGLYITGHTDSRNFPLKKATQNQYGGGNQDGFLAIVHSINFQRLMSTYVGLEGNDETNPAVLNPLRGDLYLPGFSFGANNNSYVAHFKPKVSNANSAKALAPQSDYNPPLFAGYNRGIILGGIQKYVAKGNFYFPHPPIGGRSEAVAAQSATPTVLFTLSGVCVPPSGATTCNDSASALFFDQDLNFQTAINFGGPLGGAFFVNDVAVGPGGNLYFVGDTQGNFLPKVNAFQANRKGKWEGFVVSITAASSQVTLSSYIGGVGNDFAKAVAVDKSGNIVIVGETGSKKFPTSVGALDRTLGGVADGFAVKITP